MSTTIDGITTSNSIDAYGNSYTTAISGNDNLESDDFITLMLTELSMQDPTDPVDSSSMLDDQLSMQTLETNISLSESMSTLATSFEQSNLSTSAGLIGNIVETGETDDEGNTSQYKISSVEGVDGQIYLTGYEISEYYDVYYFDEISSSSDTIDSSSEDSSFTFTNSSGDSYEIETNGKTYEELASEINDLDGITASIVENSNGNYQLVTSISGAGSSFTQSGSSISYTTDNATAYNSEAETFLYSNVTKIY